MAQKVVFATGDLGSANVRNPFSSAGLGDVWPLL